MPILIRSYTKVIDEADRLLAQSFQDWLSQVLSAIRPPKNPVEPPSFNYSTTLHADAVNPAFFPPPERSGIWYIPEKAESSCQKLLFSATLTRDPDKIAALELRHPKYFIVQDAPKTSIEAGIMNVVMEKFSTPATLRVGTSHYYKCFKVLIPITLGTHARLRFSAKAAALSSSGS
jgi:ATP-dependent RNA helicase DDX51/DBP6